MNDHYEFEVSSREMQILGDVFLNYPRSRSVNHLLNELHHRVWRFLLVSRDGAFAELLKVDLRQVAKKLILRRMCPNW